MTALDGDDGASICKVIATHEGSADSGLTNMFSTVDVVQKLQSYTKNLLGYKSLSTMSDAGDAWIRR